MLRDWFSLDLAVIFTGHLHQMVKQVFVCSKVFVTKFTKSCRQASYFFVMTHCKILATSKVWIGYKLHDIQYCTSHVFTANLTSQIYIECVLHNFTMQYSCTCAGIFSFYLAVTRDVGFMESASLLDSC